MKKSDIFDSNDSVFAYTKLNMIFDIAAKHRKIAYIFSLI